MIPWLAPGQPFPPVSAALQTPNGLLAASAELTADRLLAAYPQGIFPWYSDEEPVFWWSPDPRMVLFTDEFKVSRSFSKTLRKTAHDPSIELRVDADFDAVIQACAEPRGDDAGTWITDSVVDAYMELHRRGLAHSVETWVGGAACGRPVRRGARPDVLRRIDVLARARRVEDGACRTRARDAKRAGASDRLPAEHATPRLAWSTRDFAPGVCDAFERICPSRADKLGGVCEAVTECSAG